MLPPDNLHEVTRTQRNKKIAVFGLGKGELCETNVRRQIR
jgi:hypothetical protein